MASRASIGGHPIHPMLIPFPIGLLVFSFVADLIYLWRGKPVWKDYIAFHTMLGGMRSRRGHSTLERLEV